ncbi:hypothetical protein [Ancylobacter rudongensis]|uniref:Uncharacterized protein n=1 Tax=Ancylobacter rudongensis TaxID=177413 RepID=A0A1G4UPN2_9HYPH|nr:hypothetical protein [Ancylobacter rudongensis]SCW95494.1 hypothetical protein SAMN05660859_0041 [Ancylobacter rudongensis]
MSAAEIAQLHQTIRQHRARLIDLLQNDPVLVLEHDGLRLPILPGRDLLHPATGLAFSYEEARREELTHELNQITMALTRLKELDAPTLLGKI